MSERRQSYDPVFFLLAMLLVGFGLLALASASMGISAAEFGHPYYYLLHQIAFGFLPGMLGLFVVSKIPYQTWRRYAPLLLVVSLVLMFLVFVPFIGLSHGGARRWILLGPVSFQPSEFLKFSFIIYLAAWLETRTRDIHSLSGGLMPFLIMSGFVASFLVLQPDIGTLGVLLLTAVGLFIMSGGQWKHIGILFLIGCVALGVLAFLEPYRLNRITVFLNPEHDPQGIGYQVRQALIAIGSGGMWGRGFALSRQKFSYLPEPMGDSIFAIVGEELGLVGTISLIVLFVLLYLRGATIVKSAPDLFGKFLGMGILLLIIIQAFINMGAISGLGPLTGIPLSLVSYGGSALAITLLEIGIILNISKTRS